MKHICKNWMYEGICGKCGITEWVLYFKEVKYKKGDLVKLPTSYTGNKYTYTVVRQDKYGYVINSKKTGDVSCYSWWELYPIREV